MKNSNSPKALNESREVNQVQTPKSDSTMRRLQRKGYVARPAGCPANE